MRTKIEEKTVHFSVRHLALSLRDRLRVQAAKRRATVEAVANEALAIGLETLEDETMAFEKRARGRA